MKLIFVSLTGNVRNFVDRTEMTHEEIHMSNPFIRVDEDFIMIIPTYDSDMSDFYRSFIEFADNKKHLIGFVGSGNLNFGDEYCFTAKLLSALYVKPLIATFELNGTNKDIAEFKKEVRRFEVT